MGQNASISGTQFVDLTSAGDLGLGALSSAGDVRLNISGGAIADNNGAAQNIAALNLTIVADQGVGTVADPLETAVSNLNALNNIGAIGLINANELFVTALRTDGDINLINTEGSVTIVNVENARYDQSAIHPINAGGVINSNYNNPNTSVDINVQNGDLIAANPPAGSVFSPEIVGYDVFVDLPNGEFGIDGRPIVVYAVNALNVENAIGGILPRWAFNQEPLLGLITNIDLLDPSVVGSVNELLVEVESIGEIDPAVFSEVRNYSYDNISIRLPRDQLYDDEEDEEEDQDLVL